MVCFPAGFAARVGLVCWIVASRANAGDCQSLEDLAATSKRLGSLARREPKSGEDAEQASERRAEALQAALALYVRSPQLATALPVWTLLDDDGRELAASAMACSSLDPTLSDPGNRMPVARQRCDRLIQGHSIAIEDPEIEEPADLVQRCEPEHWRLEVVADGQRLALGAEPSWLSSVGSRAHTLRLSVARASTAVPPPPLVDPTPPVPADTESNGKAAPENTTLGSESSSALPTPPAHPPRDGKPPRPTWRLWVGVSAAAAGGAMLLASGQTWKVARDRYDGLRAECPDKECPSTSYTSSVSAGKRWVAATNVLLAGGIGVAGAGLGLIGYHFVFGDSAAADVGASCLSDGCALSASGHF